MSVLGCVPLRPDPTLQQKALYLVDQGVAHLRRGEFDRAEASFQVARELAPLAAAADGLGCVALLQGRSAQAEQFFEEALELDSGYTEVLGNMALLYEHTGQVERAELMYQRALHEDPDSMRVRNNYGVFLATKGREGRGQAKRHFLGAAALEESGLVSANMLKISEMEQ